MPLKKYYVVRRVALMVAALLLILMLAIIPFNLVIAPERKLKIIDSDGRPIENALVRRTWAQYSLRQHGEERLRSGYDGDITLPKQIIRTRIIDIMRGALYEFKSHGIHASYWSSEYVSVRVNDQVRSFYYGKGLEEGRIVMDGRKQ